MLSTLTDCYITPYDEVTKHYYQFFMPKAYMTVKEVAKLLGVTPLTIRNWDARGKLVAYRHPVNNYRMYKTEDVENILKDIEESKGKPPVARLTKSSAPQNTEPEKPKAKKLEIDIF